MNEHVLEAIPSHWLVPEREEGLVTPECRVYHGWAVQQWRSFRRDGPRELPKDLRQRYDAQYPDVDLLNLHSVSLSARLANVFLRLNDLETPRLVMEQ